MHDIGGSRGRDGGVRPEHGETGGRDPDTSQLVCDIPVPLA